MVSVGIQCKRRKSCETDRAAMNEKEEEEKTEK